MPEICAAADALVCAMPVSGKAFSMALAQAAVATVAADKRALLPPFPWPLYLIGTRDSFTHELVTCCSKVCFLITWVFCFALHAVY